MEVKVIVRGVEDAASVRGHAQKRVETALKRYAGEIAKATVRLIDETGPRKEKDDKVCSIELTVKGAPVRVREVSNDFKTSISLALGRVRTVLSREMGRRKRGIGAG